MNSRVGRLGGHSHDSRNLTFLFRSREATTHRVYLNEVDTPLFRNLSVRPQQPRDRRLPVSRHEPASGKCIPQRRDALCDPSPQRIESIRRPPERQVYVRVRVARDRKEDFSARHRYQG